MLPRHLLIPFMHGGMHLVRQASIRLMFLTGSIALIVACSSESRAKLDTTAAGAFALSSQPLGPIPPDDSLARPKSIQQVGVPTALTRSVIPKDNPQTPEKIAIGEKLFLALTEETFSWKRVARREDQVVRPHDRG